MTIKHLNTFIVVAETLSTTKASQILYTSQPAVSLTISQMEKYYGVKLFRRINKRLQLTKEGESLLSMAKKVIRDFNRFESAASTMSESRQIKIGVSAYTAKKILPIALKDLSSVNDVDIYISCEESQTIQSKIETGEYDLAIVQSAFELENFNTLYSMRDDLVLVASPDYPLNQVEDLKELTEHHLLLSGTGTEQRETFDYIFKQHFPIVDAKWESNDFDTLINAAQHGLGIAAVNHSMVKSAIRKGKLKIIKTPEVEFIQYILILCSKDIEKDRYTKYIFNQIVEALKSAK